MGSALCSVINSNGSSAGDAQTAPFSLQISPRPFPKGSGTLGLSQTGGVCSQSAPAAAPAARGEPKTPKSPWCHEQRDPGDRASTQPDEGSISCMPRGGVAPNPPGTGSICISGIHGKREGFFYFFFFSLGKHGVYVS